MKGKVFPVLFWGFIILLLLNFHLRGAIPHDEGQMLNAASKLLAGQIPYKDFQFFYTPFSIFLLSLTFKVFGESILIEKLLAFAISLGSSYLIWEITYQTSKKIFWGILSVLLFIFWGSAVINFVWPVMLCIFLGLLNLKFVLAYQQKSKTATILLIGFTAALVLLTKQNFGIAILVVNFLTLILNSKFHSKEVVKHYLFGFILPILLFFSYLLVNNSLAIFFKEMYYIMFVKIAGEGMLATPFVYTDVFLNQIVRTGFYLLPLLVGITALFVCKEKKTLYPIILLPTAYYLLGIRPTTDFVHLAPFIAMLSLPLSVLFLKKKKLSIVFLIALLILGVHSVLFRGLYKWEAPILMHNNYAGSFKTNVFIDDKHKIVFDTVIPIIRNSSSEYIFIYHYSPIFYFLSDKKNPTRYDNLPPEIFTENVQIEVIKDITNASVDTIVIDKKFGDKTLFAKFINENFTPVLQLSELSIWKKK